MLAQAHEMGGVVAIISQMITPAILILACGNLVGSSLIRIGRVVDRVRALGTQMNDPQLDVYLRRARHLERALIAYYGAIALFVLSSLLIALSIVFPAFLLVPTIVTIVGAFSVLYGAVQSLLEIRISAGDLLREIGSIETNTAVDS